MREPWTRPRCGRSPQGATCVANPVKEADQSVDQPSVHTSDTAQTQKTRRLFGTGCSLWIIVVSSILALLGHGPSAMAGAPGNRGTAYGNETAVTGTWGATATTTAMAFSSNTYQSSTISNTGSIALSGISYKVTITKPATGSPTFKVYACPVSWASNKCSGGAGTEAGGTLVKNTSTTLTSTIVPAVGGHVYLQVEPSGVTSSVTVTLATSITSPTQLRTGVMTSQ